MSGRVTRLALAWGVVGCAAGELEDTPQALGSAAAPLLAANAASDAGPGGDAGAPGAPPALDAGVSASNDCCTTASSGGCADETVEACVCAGDPFCCAVEFDAFCALEAVSRCGLDCDERPPASDCCEASDVPGCAEPAIAACICAIDPFCCVFRFDQNCVNLATSRCAATCEGGAP